MPRQNHDLGVIKRDRGQKPFSKERLARERRKRALPYLYPGWDDDSRPIRDVKEHLRRKREGD